MISVLLVDDEPAILDIARAFLERHGEFSVTTALSAEEGMRLLQEKSYDAVISDYEMPIVNGLDFLKSIRESGNKVPFIIFTGRGREDVVIEALNQGANYYIQKGGDPRAQFTELAYKIRESVRRRRASSATVDHDQFREKVISQINAISDLLIKLEDSGLKPEQIPLLDTSRSKIKDLLLLFGHEQ
jgi:DNA-binding response OmpR family regulator